MRRCSPLVLLCFLSALLLLIQRAAADDFQLEPGYTLIFNGKDLTGWKVRKGGEALDGKTEAANRRFHVSEGKLIIDPKIKGDVIIDTAKSFGGDVVIRFQYLPGPKCNNDLYFRGLKFDLKIQDVKNLKEGEWNDFEIVVQGDQVQFKNNGEVQRTEKAKNASSELGIRAELGPAEYRHIRVKAASIS